jgi:glycosyltransferase involved in cell wall biosynthesis
LKSADVVLINTQWNYFFLAGCRLASSFNRPYIIRPEGIFSLWALSYKKWRKKIWWEIFDRKNYERAAAIVALTKEEAFQIRNMGISPRVEVIPNGVNLDDFTESLTREEIEIRFPQLKDRRWLLFMGRLHPIKGVDLLIEAFAKLRRKIPDAILVLAGPNEGNYQAIIDRYSKKLAINEDICFTGMVSGDLKNGFLKQSEIFCLTSYSEGLPMGVLEAMACGLPVVITHECRIPEIKEYNAGILVERNPDKIAEALLLIMEDKEIKNQMKYNALGLIKVLFTQEAVCQKYENLFQSII